MIKRILSEEVKGRSLNEAIAKVLPANRRSWALRRIPQYREQGFEALIDARTPREAKVSVACRQVVQAAPEANPRLTVEEALEILRMQRMSSSLKHLVRSSRLRCRVERDYEDLKQEVGLDHFEGCTWQGFHHHAALCSAAHAFLALRRALFPPEEPAMDSAGGSPPSSLQQILVAELAECPLCRRKLDARAPPLRPSRM